MTVPCTKCLLCNKLHNKPIVWKQANSVTVYTHWYAQSLNRSMPCSPIWPKQSMHNAVTRLRDFMVLPPPSYKHFVILRSLNAINGVSSAYLPILRSPVSLFHSQWSAYKLFYCRSPTKQKPFRSSLLLDNSSSFYSNWFSRQSFPSKDRQRAQIGISNSIHVTVALCISTEEIRWGFLV